MPSQQIEALETINALKRKLKREKEGKLRYVEGDTDPSHRFE